MNSGRLVLAGQQVSLMYLTSQCRVREKS